MSTALRLVSLLSLGDSYGSFLNRFPVSTLTTGSLKKVAKLALLPRGLNPDLSSDVLESTVKTLIQEAEAKGVKNLADLLLDQDASTVFFRWAAGRIEQEAASNGDSLSSRLGVLNALKELDFIPTSDPADYATFVALVQEHTSSDRVEEFAMLTYNHALEKGQSIREYLLASDNRSQIASLFFTVAGREEGINPLNQKESKENVPNRRRRRLECSNNSRFAVTC